MAQLVHLLRSKAVLMPGVTVTLVHEKTGEIQSWLFKGGLLDYLMQSLAGELVIPVFEGDGFADAQSDNFAAGEGASWCVAFTEDGPLVRESYVNLIPTSAGGTHESGLRDGLFTAVKSFVELHALLPKGVKLLPEDVFARASYVLSAKVLDPQFQGQIKERLNSRDAVRLVSGFVRPALELWLNQHVEYGKKLAELAIKAAQSRQKAGQKVEKRKGSGVAVLPGKLTDCESRDLAHNEVFLVEGDSAGGSAKMGRDKESQAILPLRGKVLNTWEVERDRLFANTEIHDIAVAIGVDPHGPGPYAEGKAPDLSGLRYGKGMRAPGSWNPSTDQCNQIVWENTLTSLDLVHSGKSKNGSLICNGLASDFPDREKSFLSLPPYRGVELLKKFGITMTATRNQKLGELVGEVFHQVVHETARRLAERQFSQKTAATQATESEHLKSFEVLWEGLAGQWISSLTAAESRIYGQLQSENERDVFRIIRSYARKAKAEGLTDFPIARDNLAERIGVTGKGAAWIRDKLARLGAITKTAKYVPNKSATRYRWIADVEAEEPF